MNKKRNVDSGRKSARPDYIQKTISQKSSGKRSGKVFFPNILNFLYSTMQCSDLTELSCPEFICKRRISRDRTLLASDAIPLWMLSHPFQRPRVLKRTEVFTALHLGKGHRV